MSTKFASGKRAIAICDRCGQQFKLKELKEEIVRTREVNVRVCKECWDPDHPQLKLGMYPVYDPQALRVSRPDNTYLQSGLDVDGDPAIGSRDIQWGWNPVGLNNPLGLSGLSDNLVAVAKVGTVEVTTGG